MNNRYAILVATSIFAISSTSAQVSAATKSKQQLNLKVATVHAGDQKLSGTATKGAKIKVTRYAKTYVTGKVSAKSGKFTFKLKQPVKANWHYRVTVTKKGYKTKVVHYGVTEKTEKSVNQTDRSDVFNKLQAQIDELRSQISNLQVQIANVPSPSSVDNSDYNSNPYNGLTKAEYEAATKKMDDIETELDQKRELLNAYDRGSIDYQSSLDSISQTIGELKQKLLTDPNNQRLQYQLSKAQEEYEYFEKIIINANNAKKEIGDNIIDFKNEMDRLEKEYWALYKYIGA